jgi:hypothetical protein
MEGEVQLRGAHSASRQIRLSQSNSGEFLNGVWIEQGMQLFEWIFGHQMV